MESEKERLKFCIGRYDHYFDSVNNKSNVYLTLSVFVFGGLLGLYPTILVKTDSNLWVNVFMLLVMGIGLTAMLITILASRPYLTKETDSLLFFQSVSNMGQTEFETQSSTATEEQEINDLRIQTFQLACGLKAKFTKLLLVASLFAIQFALFIPLIILILNNLKK
jgi:hypothetical protein